MLLLELTWLLVLTHLWTDALLFSRTCSVAGQNRPNIYGFTSLQVGYERVRKSVFLVLRTGKHLEHSHGWHVNLRAYCDPLSGLSAAVDYALTICQVLYPSNQSVWVNREWYNICFSWLQKSECDSVYQNVAYSWSWGRDEPICIERERSSKIQLFLSVSWMLAGSKQDLSMFLSSRFWIWNWHSWIVYGGVVRCWHDEDQRSWMHRPPVPVIEMHRTTTDDMPTWLPETKGHSYDARTALPRYSRCSSTWGLSGLHQKRTGEAIVPQTKALSSRLKTNTSKAAWREFGYIRNWNISWHVWLSGATGTHTWRGILLPRKFLKFKFHTFQAEMHVHTVLCWSHIVLCVSVEVIEPESSGSGALRPQLSGYLQALCKPGQNDGWQFRRLCKRWAETGTFYRLVCFQYIHRFL